MVSNLGQVINLFWISVSNIQNGDNSVDYRVVVRLEEWCQALNKNSINTEVICY